MKLGCKISERKHTQFYSNWEICGVIVTIYRVSDLDLKISHKSIFLTVVLNLYLLWRQKVKTSETVLCDLPKMWRRKDNCFL